MTIHIITIGDELLIGQVIDTNSSTMAQMLQTIGGQVTGRTTIGDDRETILETLKMATQKADVVLVTGGLGPTKDDITKKTLAEFYGVGFVFHQPTNEWINKLYERFAVPMPDSIRDQCLMPQNATILTNKRGTAPGMWFDENGTVLVSMPGVPHEMEYIMEHGVIPKLQQRFPSDPFSHRTLLTVGEGESRISIMIKDFEENLPSFIKLAYLPGIGRVRLRLTASYKDEDFINAILDEKFEELQSYIPNKLIVAKEDITLEEALGKLLNKKGLTLSTAESCTGGYVAHLITSVPGSSAYYMGSVLSYSNEIKMKLLGVKKETLNKHGAVSEQTVKEMVAGALKLLNTDIAVATSGIAGPSGGTPEKPVGTIWVAVGNKNKTITHKLNLGKDRIRNIQYTTTRALNMVRLFAEDVDAK
ncbi:MAG TPA: CinA family nicotinamide mononucleotide deamidase-related protein [Bacteroidetes bacterium]|nr:CinA family nicotinamide mononucleotide deamidase-related protein [Bacteroidota bacterium]